MAMANPPPKPALRFSESDRKLLEPYLPSASTATNSKPDRKRPFVTLTFATSLDSSLSLAPGTQTILSGPETKAMTHYLRSKHDAILVGVGTAIADDPALNCRLEGVGLMGQPRPYIVDPRLRWKATRVDGRVAECVRLASEGLGQPPHVLASMKDKWKDYEEIRDLAFVTAGGQYIDTPSRDTADGRKEMSWVNILERLADSDIKSVMIEGGGHVINTLLQEKYLDLIDSVIITIAPVWVGQGGVVVSPPGKTDDAGQRIPAARLHQTKWQQFGDDVVMCGKIKH